MPATVASRKTRADRVTHYATASCVPLCAKAWEVTWPSGNLARQSYHTTIPPFFRRWRVGFRFQELYSRLCLGAAYLQQGGRAIFFICSSFIACLQLARQFFVLFRIWRRLEFFFSTTLFSAYWKRHILLASFYRAIMCQWRCFALRLSCLAKPTSSYAPSVIGSKQLTYIKLSAGKSATFGWIKFS